ncbi:MAG TPA: hypothetical protein VFA42_04000 [Gaiellaceae bacterium]|nr:hypothetical protein [Gaiellaceae bacterium]
MTLTLAIVVNAILMAGIVAAVAGTIRLPFRIDRPRLFRTATYAAGSEEELRRAA